MAVLNFHIINKTVGGKFLDKSVKRENVMHTGAQSVVFGFGGTTCNFGLEFAYPSNGATTVDQDITSS